mmetsp:Transcript_42464/g.74442  ORF Transcript_42464/g.74442 Transcript_42464/m.74442 type:complete len:200 (+) Transcript_42464:95-694(+)
MGGVCGRRKPKALDPEERKRKYAGLEPEEQLMAAACENDVQKMESLAKEGVDLHARRKEDGLFALDQCAWSGNDIGCACLLRLGADPSQSLQAVVGCATWGHTEILEAMLEGGAQVDQEFGNFTALQWACEMPHEECAKILIKYGAWKLEPNQATVLRRLKGLRSEGAKECLAAIAAADPERAKDCVMPPWWACQCQVL